MRRRRNSITKLDPTIVAQLFKTRVLLLSEDYDNVINGLTLLDTMYDVYPNEVEHVWGDLSLPDMLEVWQVVLERKLAPLVREIQWVDPSIVLWNNQWSFSFEVRFKAMDSYSYNLTVQFSPNSSFIQLDEAPTQRLSPSPSDIGIDLNTWNATRFFDVYTVLNSPYLIKIVEAMIAPKSTRQNPSRRGAKIGMGVLAAGALGYWIGKK